MKEIANRAVWLL